MNPFSGKAFSFKHIPDVTNNRYITSGKLKGTRNRNRVSGAPCEAKVLPWVLNTSGTRESLPWFNQCPEKSKLKVSVRSKEIEED